MTDRPYTDATLRDFEAEVDRLLGPYVQVDTANLAEDLLDFLASAGLLVTPRIERDTRMLGRAYIWRPLGREPVVLNPTEVDVVLPVDPHSADVDVTYFGPTPQRRSPWSAA